MIREAFLPGTEPTEDVRPAQVLSQAAMSEDVFRAVVRAMETGERAALVTIVATSGSTPQRVGAKMLVYEDGRTVGTIGGGCYENDARGKAREAIRLPRSRRWSHYALNDDLAAESGLICGGQMDVYIEPVEPAPDLYLVGAGHVSVEVARFAQATGFRVHVLDDREKFANADRFPGADVIVDDIPGWLKRGRRSRPAPSWSSSRAATGRISRRCAS